MLEKEPKIWITSDWHFMHNKPFIYEARGFDNVYDMNEAIIERHNEVVDDKDVVYCLGDSMLGKDYMSGLECIKRLKGKLKLVIGNHDTDARLEMYRLCWNVKFVEFGYRIKVGKKSLWLSHYPQLVANFDENKPVYSIYGHHHSPEHFNPAIPHGFQVSMESNNCYPIELTEVIKLINKEREK